MLVQILKGLRLYLTNLRFSIFLIGFCCLENPSTYFSLSFGISNTNPMFLFFYLNCHVSFTINSNYHCSILNNALNVNLKCFWWTGENDNIDKNILKVEWICYYTYKNKDITFIFIKNKAAYLTIHKYPIVY